MRLEEPILDDRRPERSLGADVSYPERIGEPVAVQAPPVARGDLEDFRRWVMPAVSTPSSIPELRARLAGYRSQHLPEMIELVREAEMACAVELDDLNRQIRNERQQDGIQDGECDMSILIWAEAVERWDSRITWLQNVRRYLERQQEQHEDAGARNVVSEGGS